MLWNCQFWVTYFRFYIPSMLVESVFSVVLSSWSFGVRVKCFFLFSHFVSFKREEIVLHHANCVRRHRLPLMKVFIQKSNIVSLTILMLLRFILMSPIHPVLWSRFAVGWLGSGQILMEGFCSSCWYRNIVIDSEAVILWACTKPDLSALICAYSDPVLIVEPFDSVSELVAKFVNYIFPILRRGRCSSTEALHTYALSSHDSEPYIRVDIGAPSCIPPGFTPMPLLPRIDECQSSFV